MCTILPWKLPRGPPPPGSLPRLPQPIKNLHSECVLGLGICPSFLQSSLGAKSGSDPVLHIPVPGGSEMEAKLLKPLLCTKYYTGHFGDLLPLLFKGSPVEQMGEQGLKEVM